MSLLFLRFRLFFVLFTHLIRSVSSKMNIIVLKQLFSFYYGRAYCSFTERINLKKVKLKLCVNNLYINLSSCEPDCLQCNKLQFYVAVTNISYAKIP